MSALDVSERLRQRAQELQISHSEIAKRAKISRQSWYRLLNAEVDQAKLSTLNSLSNALEIDLKELIKLYLN